MGREALVLVGAINELGAKNWLQAQLGDEWVMQLTRSFGKLDKKGIDIVAYRCSNLKERKFFQVKSSYHGAAKFVRNGGGRPMYKGQQIEVIVPEADGFAIY